MVWIFTLISTLAAEIHPQSLCGPDDRISSQYQEIGRVRGKGFCTGFLINHTCFVTAGHCIAKMNKTHVEFDVPSRNSGQVSDSHPEHIYKIDQNHLNYHRGGRGDDYAVIRLQPNEITGLFPGDRYGYLTLGSLNPPPQQIEIPGYGYTPNSVTKHTQQTQLGDLTGTPRRLEYTADTTGGTSGAPVMIPGTSYYLGVHSHGGCGTRGYNAGTSVFHNMAFEQAIRSCLEQTATTAD